MSEDIVNPAPVTHMEGSETTARSALAALRDAAKAGLKPNDQPHRVIFRDGFVLEGRAADEWHRFMSLIIEVAERALAAPASEGER